MFKWFEWIYLFLCIAFCIYAFIDKEYFLGIVFTVITVVGAINTAKDNLKKKWKANFIYKIGYSIFEYPPHNQTIF